LGFAGAMCLCRMIANDIAGDTFYWQQYLDMTTYVHKLIAQDMANVIEAHFAAL